MSVRNKKQIFILALFLACLISASKPKHIIKEIRSYSWSRASNSFIEMKRSGIIVEVFDNNNHIEKKTIYTRDKKLYETIIYDHEKAILKGKKTYDSKNDLLTRTKFTLKDNLIYELVYDSKNKLIWYYTHHVNPRAQLSEKRWYDKNEKLKLIYKYLYDATGNPGWRIICTPDDTPIHLSVYSYDKFDNLSRWVIRREDQSYADVYYHPKEKIIKNLAFAGSLEKPENRDKEGDGFKEPLLSVDSYLEMTEQLAREKSPGGRVLATALKHIKAETIIRGSCYDWINMVYKETGYTGKTLERIFRGKKNGPFANPLLLKPGDWIMFRNLTYGDIEHSGIFLGWLDFETKSAMVIGYVGQKRVMPSRFREYDITRLFGIMRGKE
ncbi:MAG: hypothetical protein JW827_01155 [Spirochaetes bacterium]|nr:hypothetical protein [Spirochaetota bacterium]